MLGTIEDIFKFLGLPMKLIISKPMRTETTETKTGIHAVGIAERLGIAIAMLSSLVMGFVFSSLLFSDYLEVGTVVRYQPAAPVVYKDAGTRLDPKVILVKRSTTTKSDVFEQAVKNGVSKYNASKTTVDKELQRLESKALLERTSASAEKAATTTATAPKVSVSKIDRVVPSGSTIQKSADGKQKSSVLEQWYAVTLNQPADTEILTDTLKKTVKEIEAAQPQYVYTANLAPNDTYYPKYGSWGQPFEDLWGLKPRTTNVEYAWDQGTGDSNIVVAVSDSGVDATHPDLDASMWVNSDEIAGNNIDDDSNGFIDDINGWNFAVASGNGNKLINDLLGHGTHVAGTIAAEQGNSAGISGICPKCRIMAVRGLGDEGYGLTSWLAAGIIYAASNGADVINMSWGSPRNSEDDALLEDVLQEARDIYGITLVAAAGNDSSNANNFFPAGSQYVITVAATDANDHRAFFSNYGAAVDVAAPGVDVLSLLASNTSMYGGTVHVVDGQYLYASGTSMAAPHISGIVGLMLSKNPQLTPSELQQILQSTADDVNSDIYPGWDAQLGNGRVNAQVAIAAVANATLRGQLETIPKEYGYTIGEDINITGTAYGSNFASYKLEVGAGVMPTAWLKISNSTTPVSTSATLGTLETENFFGIYTLKLTIQGKDGTSFSDASQLQVVNKSGWPKNSVQNDFSRDGLSKPQTIRDAQNNIIGIAYASFADFYGNGNMTVLRPDGQVLPGWPINIGSIITPSAIDLNQDGTMEILYMNSNFEIRARRLNGTEYSTAPIVSSLKSGLKDVYVTDYLTASDIDTAHPGMEILVRILELDTTNWEKRELIYAWHTDGTLVAGWPVEKEIEYPLPTYFTILPPAIGDVDGNGDLEIVWQSLTNKLFAYNHDGTPLAGFSPPHLDLLGIRAPVLADIDADYKAEILTSNLNVINVYDETGKPQFNCLPEYMPDYQLAIESLIPADLDKDGAAELVVVGYDPQRYTYVVTAIRRNGQTMPGKWPRYVEFGTEPLVKDITGDGYLDIIVGSRAYAGDGTDIENWPMNISAFSSQLVEDFDADGKYELLFKDEQRVYMWDLPYAVNTAPVAWESPYGGQSHANSTNCPTCTAAVKPYDSQCARCGSTSACTQADCNQCISGSCDLSQCACKRPAPYLNGWPRNWDYMDDTMPTLAELNGSGSKEMVLFSYAFPSLKIEAYNVDGTIVPGWPVKLVTGTYGDVSGGYLARTLKTISAADINGDSRDEIVSQFSSQGALPNFGGVYAESGIIAFSGNGQLLPGFPVVFSQDVEDVGKTVVLRDVLTGTSHVGMEIIAAFPSKTNAFRIFNSNGTLAASGNAVFAGVDDSAIFFVSNTVVEDVDYDGQAEVVAMLSTSYGATPVRKLFVWNLDGSLQAHWIVSVGEIPSTITVGDIDPAFAGLEIITGENNLRTSPIYAFHHNGTAVNGWPFLPSNLVVRQYNPNSMQISIGDVTGDGVPEIVAAVYDEVSQRIYVLNRDGSQHAFFNHMYGGANYKFDQFSLVDVDNDNVSEIVGPDGLTLNAWNHDGSIATGFPLNTWSHEGLGDGRDAYPAFGDWNSDGKLDVILVDGGKVQAFDLGVPWHPEASPWAEGYGGPTRRSLAGKYLTCTGGTFSGACSSDKRYCQETTLLPQQCNRCGLTCSSGYTCQANGKCCQKVNGTLKCINPIVPTSGIQ
jgi:subtilisin family serine protease